ncbi:MAG TPA: DNA recombination protein RmuC [Lysobacter sp.]|nr:DNA recombination protein RmuC [Lysobacter sp.]
MELAAMLLAIVLSALAIYVALARLLKARAGAPEALAALREERDRLHGELQVEREAARAHAAEVARLQERLGALERVQAALGDAEARAQAGDAALREAHTRLAEREAELRQLRLHADEAARKLAALDAELPALRARYEQARAHLEHSERANAEMKAFLEQAQQRLSATFAELAGRTFADTVQDASARSRADIETLLKPFAERIGEFRTRVDQLYAEEARERAALVGAVNELKSLNQDMAQRAHELTRALKGNAKVRGDWGELMLESVLRGSGLEEGVHYDRQKSATDDDGRRLQPDIVVRLPGERRIVIDSKVNLIAWQDAMNADTPEAHQDALRRHAVALRQHVKDLAERNYPRALGDGALDVTLLFVPIEGALSAALGADDALQAFAFERRVVFASPNTLMLMLRVVDRLWMRDKIQREAVEISQHGGRLLDALCGFLEEFDQVGARLEQADRAFRNARTRLSESPQAVIPRARRLAELGARGKRALPEELAPESPAQALLLSALDDAS